MRIELHHRFTRLRRYLPAQYFLPIALILALSLGCLFALLFHLTNVQDRMERDREQELVANASGAALRLAVHDLRDYAMWDEAVTHLIRDFDRDWADDNLGPYLVNEQGYDYLFVIDDADRPAYAYHQGAERPGLDPHMVLGPAFGDSIRALHRQTTGRPPVVSGYARHDGAIYIFSIASIVPLTNKVTLPDGRSGAIMVARRVDPAFFTRLSADQQGPTLGLTHLAPAKGVGRVALNGTDGGSVGYLTWQPRKPGTALRDQILPAFVAVGLACLFVAGLVLRRGRRAVEALQFSETRAHHLAKHDLLTGLPNRRALQEHLEALLDTQAGATLLYMDLDGFKQTNDVYGHGAGDDLLRIVAERLEETVAARHMLARVGGDEFAVVAEGTGAEGPAVARAILSAFATAFPIGGFRVSLGVSIGLATDADVSSADELVRRADAAMYAAKASGKQCMRIYSSAIDADRELRKQLEADLRSAIELQCIGVVFQPIVHAHSHAVCTVEALARWDHPRLGMISPDQFIPIAEESGLIVALGRQVLASACREARGWDVDLAVNLSPAQFWDRGLAETVMDVLAETGFPPERLELEITEGYLLRRPDDAADILRRLKGIGVRISLDDFGTGFASIGYLQKLGFDSIKIDRSFVSAAAAGPQAADLARAIIALGDALNLPVTAEGVETMAQARLMQESGCARLQGWLFGRPMPALEMSQWFALERRAVG